MGLQVFWFVVIAFFWLGFFILEGFVLGVGALHIVVGKTDLERRVAINTIGPFWTVTSCVVHRRRHRLFHLDPCPVGPRRPPEPNPGPPAIQAVPELRSGA